MTPRYTFNLRTEPADKVLAAVRAWTEHADTSPYEAILLVTADGWHMRVTCVPFGWALNHGPPTADPRPGPFQTQTFADVRKLMMQLAVLVNDNVQEENTECYE